MKERMLAIEFERGGDLKAKLLDEEAPRTCEAVWRALPLKAKVMQARFAGEEMYFNTEIGAVPENEISPQAGDIAFNPDPQWRAICLYYGDNIESENPFNVFARILDDKEKLKEIGERVWLMGAETVRVRPL